jgi:flagellar biosynthesis protein FlhF
VPGGIEITAALETEPAPVPPITDSNRLAALAWHGVPPDLHSLLAHGDLEIAIAQGLRFGTLPLETHERPVMLTGPPGAGKTLTTVRLAMRLVMTGAAPIVITTDTRRAGATEQLAAFTRILGVPLLFANHPVSLAQAVSRCRDDVAVLIDTAGSDPREGAQADELKGLATSVNAQVALVMPAGLDPDEAAEMAVAYAECGAMFLIISRFNLVRRLGGVISAAAASQLTLTEAGIGTGMTDSLVPLTPSLLAAGLYCIEGMTNVK